MELAYKITVFTSGTILLGLLGGTVVSIINDMRRSQHE